MNTNKSIFNDPEEVQQKKYKSVESLDEVGTKPFSTILREISFDPIEINKYIERSTIINRNIGGNRYKNCINGKRIKLVHKICGKMLTKKQLDIFIKYFFLGVSEMDIARSINISQTMVSISLKSSIAKLQKYIKKFGLSKRKWKGYEDKKRYMRKYAKKNKIKVKSEDKIE
jgi:predicted DNA-binding protein YlxM (UPF0122 family)